MAVAEPPAELEGPDGYEYELPLRLLLGFRVLVDALHAELARQGHPELRPMHGLVLQAVGSAGITAAGLGRWLGITKQAAAKHIDALERLGYLDRSPHPRDVRSTIVSLTARGVDAHRRCVAILATLQERWAATIGPDRLRALRYDLRRVTPDQLFPVDAPAWFGGGRP